MKYSISNQVWKYIVTTDDYGFIISTNNSPNNRPHWSIGWNIEELKTYYHRDNSSAGPTPAIITQIE